MLEEWQTSRLVLYTQVVLNITNTGEKIIITSQHSVLSFVETYLFVGLTHDTFLSVSVAPFLPFSRTLIGFRTNPDAPV